MKSSTRVEISRIINNRESEEHPFKRNSAGLEWFSRMIPLVDELTRQEIEEFLLPMLDNLLSKLTGCMSCRAKLLVFSEIYCSRKAPSKAAEYWRQYKEGLPEPREDMEPRDYRSEVYEAIDRYGSGHTTE